MRKYGDRSAVSAIYLHITGLDNLKDPNDKELCMFLFGTKEQIESQGLSSKVADEVRDFFRLKYIGEGRGTEENAKNAFPPLN